MHFRDKKRRSDTRRIEMTPMIDCVFQLLLFFLVTSHFNEEARALTEGELSAILPEAAAAMPMVTKPREMIINVDNQGRYIVGGQEHTETQLANLLRRAQIDNPGGQSVIIRGDERVDWKHVARVMGLCNQANISDYRVAVVPQDEQTPEEG